MARQDDIEDIRQVTYRYFWGWDTDDVESVVSSFTEDAVHDESALGIDVVNGHGELRAMFAKLQPNLRHSFHPVTNHMIEFADDDHASGICYFDGQAISVEGIHITAKAYFDDSYVRTTHGWRIAARKLHPLMPMQMEGMPD